jgi:hypothetical protein
MVRRAIHPLELAAVGAETEQLMPVPGSELVVSELTRTISMVAFAILVSLTGTAAELGARRCAPVAGIIGADVLLREHQTATPIPVPYR